MSDQKILIVDYDAKSLENMVDLFSSYKFEIITAVDGQDAQPDSPWSDAP